MPHYADGTVAKVGDLVQIVAANQSQKVLGALVSITPGSTSCNGQVLPFARKYGDYAWVPVASPYLDCITISDLLPVAPVDTRVPAEPATAPVPA
jgi:hypothetical protein